MTGDHRLSADEIELKAAIESILNSPARKKLVVAGPGTGKTYLFRQILELAAGDPDRQIVLTFINNLKKDLETELLGLAKVFTLHSYCLGLLYRNAQLRAKLSSNFRCFPGLTSLIKEDWEFIENSESPKFVRAMRNLEEENHISFYLKRGEYYNAVDFDDTVYRVYSRLVSGSAVLDSYDLVLIDEYQDFNRLEAGFIEFLGMKNPIVIAGDDDQALYSQLRHSSWDYIRSLHTAGEYEVFELPFCMRCPKAVVGAVGDILVRAKALGRLEGRIEKPYKYFSPVKGIDSEKYPKIALVQTTVQRQNANYIGRYIAKAIAEIPGEEIVSAINGGYQAALVIASRPYRDQIISCLENMGHIVDGSSEPIPKLSREIGISLLKENRESNLGWRIILSVDAPPFAKEVITQTENGTLTLFSILPNDFCDSVLEDVDAYELPEEELENERTIDSSTKSLPIRVTSFEGAKGLSAQHVFIAGLHDHELPQNPEAIKDIEICKFVVGLTRTRKMCSIIYTRNFAGKRKLPSSLISWIDTRRLKHIKVDAAYWNKET